MPKLRSATHAENDKNNNTIGVLGNVAVGLSKNTAKGHATFRKCLSEEGVEECIWCQQQMNKDKEW